MTATDILGGQRVLDAQRSNAAEDLAPAPTSCTSISTRSSSAREQTSQDQTLTDAPTSLVLAPDLAPATAFADTKPVPLARTNTPNGQPPSDTQLPDPVGGQASRGRIARDAHGVDASAPDGGSPPAIPIPTPSGRSSGGSLSDPILTFLADVLDDLENTRKANKNRLDQLTRNTPDEDGIQRGLGLDPEHPEVARMRDIVEGIAEQEHKSIKNLEKRMRAHPLGPWQKAHKGVGEKQLARLLAAIGDPYWNSRDNRPRRVSELWSYAGYSVKRLPAGQSSLDIHGSVAGGSKPRTDQASVDVQNACVGPDQASHPGHVPSDTQELSAGVAVRRQKGTKANWSTDAKTRAYLIAESCLKQRTSPYRTVYDQRKTATEGRTHAAPCAPCGKKNNPAPAGTPWKDGHRHTDALRITAKTLLRDLWLEARQLHGEDTQ